QVLQTQKPSIGNLSQGPVVNRHAFTVRVPVVQNGVIKYVLTAIVRPSSISALLALQRLPPDWVGVVLDGNRRFVARTTDPERNLGQLASESLRSALDHDSEGWVEGSTIEARNVYTAYNRSTFSGWTVALGIPAVAVNASFQSSLLYLASFGIMFLAFGVALAWFVSTRTAGSIRSLANVASNLGLGKEAAANNVPDR